MRKKSIIPLNKQDQPHGYCEIYFSNENLWYKGYYDNGKIYGYWEMYDWINEIRIHI